MKKRTKKEKTVLRHRAFVIFSAAVIIVSTAAFAFLTSAVIKNVRSTERTKKADTGSSNTQSASSEPPSDGGSTAVATVINTGDIILHDRIFKDAQLPDGSFDFSDFFKVADKYFKSADYAVANLEVTLGGAEAGAFSGFPAFNSPDSLLDPVKNAGIKLLLTANNHSYDTRLMGLKRTVSKVEEYGFDHIGTKENENGPTFIIKDVNGIKIGITCFTYETKSADDGRKTLNGNVLAAEAQNLVNSFDYDEIESFYKTAKGIIGDMRSQEADAIVFYMHWGEEYKLSPNDWQQNIAQKLCDMGVDVIVGGHPHVLQPVSVIHSKDGGKTTVCAYSLGNAISNQRRELLKSLCPTGHTEDGALFSYTFTKSADGSTALTGVDLIPTYLHKYTVGGKYRYTMYPLDNADTVNSYGLDASTTEKMNASYKRTREIVSAGLTECQKTLGCEERFKD